MTLRAARSAGAAAQPEPPRQADVAGVRGALYRLFPAPPRPEPAPWRRRALTAAAALVAFLAVSWVAGFRYAGMRSVPAAHPWPPVAAEWRHDCEVSRTGAISAEVPHGYTTIPCDRLRF